MGLSENTEDLLKVGAGLFWSIAYVLIIIRGFKDRTFGMPLVALCANIAWEIAFSFIYLREPPQSYINTTWFILDLVIVAQALRFGPRELDGLVPRRWFYPAFLLGSVVSLLIIIGISEEFQSWNGLYSAFGQTLLMSVLFIFMLRARPDLRGQSLYVGIFKLLGTLCVSILFYFRDPNSLLMVTLYLSILLFDLLYVAMVYVRQRQLGQSPWRRA